MNKLYENILENMMVDLESSPLSNLETEMSEKIERKTNDKKQTLLSMISKENNLEADELLGDIEYFNKTKAYECGFRRAMFIMLDTLLGSSMKSVGGEQA